MKLVFIKPCREVRENDDGTYALDGIFHELRPRRYPCELPALHVAIEFEQEMGESNDAEFALRFADAAGRLLWEMKAPFRFEQWPGAPARFWATVVIESSPVIEAPGVYRFEVFHGERLLGAERIVYGPA